MFHFRYHFKKEKKKVFDRLESWENLLTNQIVEMMSYKGYNVGDVFRLFRTLENILIANGVCACIMLNDKLFFGRVSFVGNLDEFGDLTDAVVFTENGKNYTFKNWRENPNIVIIYNNYMETGDADNISRYASILADVDKSIKHNVIFSRYNPLFVVHDEKEKKQIEMALKNNENGELGVIVSESFPGIDNEKIYTANITDVKDQDKIQYLSKCHDDIVKRFWGEMYGLNMNSNTSKMAQMSIEELNNGEELSKVLPIIRLKCRQLGIEQINKKFGTNITVTFSQAWDSILKEEEHDNPKNENVNETEEEPTEDPTDETQKGENEND